MVESLESGNTFGAKYWTDGKCEAPMLPDAPWLCRHPDTGELFWTDACDQVAERAIWEKDQLYADVPFAEEPMLDDYIRALETGLAAAQEKERYVRVRYWWKSNDPVRQGGDIGGSEDAFRRNLSRLHALLDTSDPNQRLMAAEAARELQNFADSKSLLEYNFPENYSRAVTLIKRLVNEENSQVALLS